MGRASLLERVSLRQSLLRQFLGGALLLVVLAAFGCGKPFNVKTQPDIATTNYTTSAKTAHFSVQAQALTDEDFLYDRFDANLLLAGVLPVRVMLTNSGSETVDLKETRFVVRAAAGASFKAVTERQAFKRLFSYYEISTYNKSGYKESLEAFSAYGLDTRTVLPGGQSRQGMVFFSMPSKVARGGSLTLVVSKLETSAPSGGGAIELKLN
jgi:hypothetical protein